jgi:hypothetical protein
MRGDAAIALPPSYVYGDNFSSAGKADEEYHTNIKAVLSTSPVKLFQRKLQSSKLFLNKN